MAGVTASVEDLEWVRNALIKRGAAVAEVVAERMGEEGEEEREGEEIHTEPRTRPTNDAQERGGQGGRVSRELLRLLQ